MSEEKKNQNENKQPQPQAMGQVLAFSGQCMSEDCKSKSKKAGFCMEHFHWFKFGLLTKTGAKAKDFDKKMQDWNRKKHAA